MDSFSPQESRNLRFFIVRTELGQKITRLKKLLIWMILFPESNIKIHWDLKALKKLLSQIRAQIWQH